MHHAAVRRHSELLAELMQKGIDCKVREGDSKVEAVSRKFGATIIVQFLRGFHIEFGAKWPGSGMRMLTYFINRGGRGLSGERRAELERAKTLLSERIQGSKKSEARRRAARPALA